MKMMVKLPASAIEFTFEGANLQECTALVTLFTKLEDPEPVFEVTPLPASILVASGEVLDTQGMKNGLERRYKETDLSYRNRIIYKLVKGESYVC